MAWLNLEHQIYSELKGLPKVKHVGLALSGGEDSAALYGVMVGLAPALNWKCTLLHVHHGKDPNADQMAFRDEAQKLVESWGEQAGWEIGIFRHEGEILTSEDDFRRVRRKALFDFHASMNLDWVMTAHHQQDLLETRLIHLIRGCGGEGLRSLKFQSEIFLRPLLQVPKAEIRQYCSQRQIRILEDPSNLETEHSLRNWIRRKWLPELDSRRPGGVRTLAGSLERVSQDLGLMQRDIGDLGLSGPGEWDRHALASLPQRTLAQALVTGLKQLAGVEFTQGQVHEAMKRLDNPQKDYTFHLSGMVWSVSSTKVKVTKIEP